MKKKKIGVLTGTRAEYGLLLPLIRLIAAGEDTELALYVTGTHLSSRFGHTVDVIAQDGFTPAHSIDIEIAAGSAEGVTRSMGLAMTRFGEVFGADRPDLLVVLGDRYETFAVVAAAVVAKIPVAHLHGGERTEGAMDEAFRHSITKMAHLHFTAAEEYRTRVIQLGEDPARVFNTGAIGIDNIVALDLLSREQLEQALGITFGERVLLVTYHPETLAGSPADAFGELLAALGNVENATIVFTYPNADTGGDLLITMIDAYVRENTGKAVAFASLGQLRYLSLVKAADAVVGNSSSGIIEAPALHTPVVNIGDRQRGRLRAAGIVDCAPGTAAIAAALERALDPAFRAQLEGAPHPYGDGHAAERIFGILKNCNPEDLLHKTFYDLR